MFRLPATALPAVVLSILAGGPAAAIEATTGAELILRLGPGMEYRELATVPAQANVSVHGCIAAEAWCLVRHDGRRGWIEGETLEVVGFSRPPAPPPAAIAPAPQIVVVPVPVGADALADGIVTADDVIVGIDERFGLAAFAGRAGKPRFDGLHFGKPARHSKHGLGGLAFGKSVFHPGKFGFDGLHFPRSGGRDKFRFGAGRFGHAHVGKHGFGKEHGFDGVHFGKGEFRFHGKKRFGDGFHSGKGHHEAQFGHPPKFGGHAGRVGSFGFRVKGGWRP